MKPIKTAIIVMIAFLSFVPSSYAINAVATLTAIYGDVKLQRVKAGITNDEPGRKGMVLEDKDLVITGQNARTTLLFRDGSEIRLFQNTEFMVEKTTELKGAKKRGFFNSFKLNMGSFWGKFTKNRQRTTIKTPTATCGIKGTSISFSERNGKLNVSLSTGAVELKNEDEKIVLQAGKMVEGVTRTGSFKNKIKNLPYFIEIKPDNNKIVIPTKGNIGKIKFTVQIVNVKTKQNVERAGRIYFSLETDKIVLPSNVFLNERGFARFSARILPFNAGDYGNGKIEILSIVEGENFMNVGAGQTMLSFDIPKKHQKIINIDADSGEMK